MEQDRRTFTGLSAASGIDGGTVSSGISAVAAATAAGTLAAGTETCAAVVGGEEGREGLGRAIRIAVVCICACVSGILLKCGLVEAARELGLQDMIVDVFHAGLVPGTGYDAIFCMTGLVHRVMNSAGMSQSMPSTKVYEVSNAFDRRALRNLLLEVLRDM